MGSLAESSMGSFPLIILTLATRRGIHLFHFTY
jgi:hypothetical protein